jgi:hypothetical protein
MHFGRLVLRGVASSAIASTAVLLACTTPTIDGLAPAYDPTTLTGGAIYHFAPGRALGVYAVPTTGFHDLELAVRVATQRWTPALGYREVTFRSVGDIREADIVVVDRAAPLPVDTTGCGATWTEAAGRTVFCPSGDTARTMPLVPGGAGRTRVLIIIDVAARLDAEELLTVAVHEIGHAIGIGGHSQRASDVMYAFPIVSAPSRADARTLRYVLHRRPDLRL